MAATIHYMREHYRVRPGAVPRRHASPRPELRARTSAGVMLGILIFVLVLVMLGVWLTDGVASVGRGNGECLTSARRVCGVFPSEHAMRSDALSGATVSAVDKLRLSTPSTNDVLA
jgi:hypothetical protein